MKRRVVQDITPPKPKRSVRDLPLSRVDESRLEKVNDAFPIRINKEPNIPSRSQSPTTFSEGTEDNRPRRKLPELNTPIERREPLLKARQELAELNKPKSNSELPPKDDTPTNKSNLKIPTAITRGAGSRFGMRAGLFVGAILAISGIYLTYLFFHTGARIKVTPKTETVSLSGNKIVATKNGEKGSLTFDVISISKDDSKTVASNGEQKVNKEATGQVTIYNNYSTNTQRLIKNTRVEATDGHVYRLDSTVTVPGQTKKGSEVVPGSITVSVHADSAGEDYNIALTDFTIPGFKGDPKYTKFYGRSKTTMTGGFSGTVKTASATDIAAAKADLTASLTSAVTNEAKSQVPSGYVLFPSLIYSNVSQVPDPQKNIVRLHAELHAIVFNRDLLSAAIAKETIPTYNGENVTSGDINNLNLSPDTLDITPWNNNNFAFKLTGTTTLRFLVDKDKLSADLVGQQKTDVGNIFKKYQSIEKAEVEISPAWKSSIPTDQKRIDVIIAE